MVLFFLFFFSTLGVSERMDLSKTKKKEKKKKKIFIEDNVVGSFEGEKGGGREEGEGRREEEEDREREGEREEEKNTRLSLVVERSCCFLLWLTTEEKILEKVCELSSIHCPSAIDYLIIVSRCMQCVRNR